MKRYLLFLLTEQSMTDVEVDLNIFLNKVFDVNSSKDHRFIEVSETLYGSVSLHKNQKVEHTIVSKAPSWNCLNPEDDNESQFLGKLLSETSHHGDCVSDVAEYLLGLTDSIERANSVLEFFWICGRDYNECVDSIELYGCIKRLQLQYNALINVIVCCKTIDQRIDLDHFKRLRSSVGTLTEAVSNYRQPVWNGSVLLMGGAQPSVLLMGFRMDHCVMSGTRETGKDGSEQFFIAETNKKIFPSRNMKFVASVDFRDVPIFYVSNVCYRLSLTSPHSDILRRSHNFLDQLRVQNNLCYILRLEFGTSQFESETEEKTTEKNAKSRESWTEFIKDCRRSEDAMCFEEFGQVLGCCSFLVCAVPAKFSYVDSNGRLEEDFIYLAFRLRHPSVINGSVLHQLTLRSLEQSGTNAGNILEMIDRHAQEKFSSISQHLKGLLRFDTSSFFEAYHSVCHFQKTESLIDPSERNYLISGLKPHEDLIARVKTSSRRPSVAEQPQGNIHQTVRKNLQNFFLPEYNQDPYHQLERRLLMMKAGDLRKSQPLEGTFANLSPPSQNTVTSVTLDAAEILKYFNPDGTAAEHIRLQRFPHRNSKKRVYQYDRGSNRTQPWPECADTRYHDVYYNLGDCEELEKNCLFLRQRLGGHETTSTFSQNLKLSLPTKRKTATEASSNDLQTKDVSRSNKERRSSLPAMMTKAHTFAAGEKGVPVEKRIKNKPIPTQDFDALLDANSCDSNSGLKRESRSQRNKRKLEEVIREVLETKASIASSDSLFGPCFKRLYMVTEAFVKDLPTSRGLREEMTKIAKSHVRQTVKFEKERQKRLSTTIHE